MCSKSADVNLGKSAHSLRLPEKSFECKSGGQTYAFQDFYMRCMRIIMHQDANWLSPLMETSSEAVSRA